MKKLLSFGVLAFALIATPVFAATAQVEALEATTTDAAVSDDVGALQAQVAELQAQLKAAKGKRYLLQPVHLESWGGTVLHAQKGEIRGYLAEVEGVVQLLDEEGYVIPESQVQGLTLDRDAGGDTSGSTEGEVIINDFIVDDPCADPCQPQIVCEPEIYCDPQPQCYDDYGQGGWYPGRFLGRLFCR